MSLSVFDLFKVGIGPSSSHTVGPMVAAGRFVRELVSSGVRPKVSSVRCDVYGSLALTGEGHATDKAIVLGLLGETPAEVDPDVAQKLAVEFYFNNPSRDWSPGQPLPETKLFPLFGGEPIQFRGKGTGILWHYDVTLPRHPNALRLTALDASDKELLQRTYYSVGGGFVVGEEDEAKGQSAARSESPVPYPFSSGKELLLHGATGKSIAEIVRANERTWRTDAELDAGLDRIWSVMEACIERGCRQRGELPGGLQVKRRAPGLFDKLSSISASANDDPLRAIDWVCLFALAVNEENAAGGRVVTAPTNGAAGVIPAVLCYYLRFVPGASPEKRRDFLLTAAAIGMLYKQRASLSAAEVGCQGEVGVACSMAAAGLAAVLGGTITQVENAAEIGMEHHLGLTCDPVRGLVQIPCIERNTVGATTAIQAARLALHGDGSHHISLDRVIDTMRRTGADMQSKYKETSLGGLAVNSVEC